MPNALETHEGEHFLSSPQAILKGALESEIELSLIVGPARMPFARLHELSRSDAAVDVLRQHALTVQAVPDAARGVAVASAAAIAGRSSLALIPNTDLEPAMTALSEIRGIELPAGCGLVLMLEDDPRGQPVSDPRQAALQLGVPLLEPCDLLQLRDGIEHALRLSRAGRGPVAIVVHHQLMHASDTFTVRPNRVIDDVDGMIIKRTAARRPRRVETGGVLRTARRLELLHQRCTPNPGERVPVGFIVVGPAEGAITHLSHVLRLLGRVPTLQLQLISPIDDAVVERILTRCEQVVVLEARPGVVEVQVLKVAERLRQQGHRCGLVWGRMLPPDLEGVSAEVQANEVLHPSVLARRIIHLLHATRPTTGVARQLMPDAPGEVAAMQPRAAHLGSVGMRVAIERMLEAVNLWLHDGAPLEELGIAPSRLAVGSIDPDCDNDPDDRTVVFEIWDPVRFVRDGVAALRHASRDDRPWLLVICDVGMQDPQDMERLARGVVPADRAERVRIVLGNLDDVVALDELFREAVLLNKLTVLIVRDGPPARFDITALDRAGAEIDRLGFEPKQRAVWPIEQACEFRRPGDLADPARPHTTDDTSGPPTLDVDRIPRRSTPRLTFALSPRMEIMDVIRNQAPAQSWRAGLSTGLAQPSPIHGSQSQWRAHFAGCRARSPVVEAICLAGRQMGYTVRTVADPASIGVGRRAWTQVLFTRAGQAPSALSPFVPFGEADLLLGLDPSETIRAVLPDEDLRVGYRFRTCSVINTGPFSDDQVADRHQLQELLQEIMPHHSREEHLLLEDVAGACQAWFTTDRVTDFALLGIAFQRGYVPITPDAIEAGLAHVEQRGFARALEAFRFGRRLATESHLFGRPRIDSRHEARHIIRRTTVLLRGRRFTGPGLAERFTRLIDGSLLAMPGLSETEGGRQARRDFVLAVRRCVVWGGVDYAERYCALITALYRADRGDQGRTLTRLAILPLAEAMLIRDPPYVLAMATGPEQRRLTRLQFNVKRAREDRIERHYTMRSELIVYRTRIRVQLYAGETTARLIAQFRRFIPLRWRGNRRARELSQAVSSLVSSATVGVASDYDRWKVTLKKLHGLAASGQMRSMTAAEMTERVEEPAGEAE